MKHDIASPSVSLGGAAFDESGRLEHVEVMSQEVPAEAGQLQQLLHRSIAPGQMIYEQKPGLVAKGVVEDGPLLEVHHSNNNDST
jgi:hypothetical protein